MLCGKKISNNPANCGDRHEYKWILIMKLVTMDLAVVIKNNGYKQLRYTITIKQL
jgi:hypothetical protein